MSKYNNKDEILFDGFSLENIKKSHHNKAINEQALKYYRILLNLINRDIANKSNKESYFKSIINFYLDILQSGFTKEKLKSCRLGGKNAYNFIYVNYLGQKNILNLLRNNEISIIKEFLNSCYDTKVIKEININKSSNIYTVYFHPISQAKVLKSTKNKLQFEGTYYPEFNWHNQSISRFINVPDSFYFSNFLNFLCKGIALKLITNLNYDEFSLPYTPLFKSKYISRGLNKEVYNKLLEVNAINKQQLTLFSNEYANKQLEWILTPKWTFAYFFSKLPIELLNDYYISNGKINIEHLLPHFTNISRSNYDDGNRKRTINYIKNIRDKAKKKTTVYDKLDDIIQSIQKYT